MSGGRLGICQSVTVLFLAVEAFGRSRDGPVIDHLGSDRRVVLASGSFLRPLCGMDPDVNCSSKGEGRDQV